MKPCAVKKKQQKTNSYSYSASSGPRGAQERTTSPGSVRAVLDGAEPLPGRHARGGAPGVGPRVAASRRGPRAPRVLVRTRAARHLLAEVRRQRRREGAQAVSAVSSWSGIHNM